MSDIKRDDMKKSNIIFVHSKIDDLGLSPYEFRVYAHIARRAGDGDCFPAIESISKQCQCKPETVREVISNLVSYNLIERTDRPGLSPLYRLTHASEWKGSLVGTFASKRTIRRKKTPQDKGEGLLPLRSEGGAMVRGEGYPSGQRGGHPPGQRGDEVYPLKGIHSKGIQRSLTSSFHRCFIEGWSTRFETYFGSKYLFQSGKDAAAVKTLSRAGIEAEAMLAIAEQAWGLEDAFLSNISRSIAGFSSKFNEIQTVGKGTVAKKGPVKPCFENDYACR